MIVASAKSSQFVENQRVIKIYREYNIMKQATFMWALSCVFVALGLWEEIRHWEGASVFIAAGVVFNAMGIVWVLVYWTKMKIRVDCLSDRVDKMKAS